MLYYRSRSRSRSRSPRRRSYSRSRSRSGSRPRYHTRSRTKSRSVRASSCFFFKRKLLKLSDLINIYKPGIFVNFEKKMSVKMMNLSLDTVQHRNIRINCDITKGLKLIFCQVLLLFIYRSSSPPRRRTRSMSREGSSKHDDH